MMACPFNALSPEETDERVAKCNLCPEEDIPPCVKVCQSGALICQDPGTFARDKMKKFLRDQKVHGEVD
jgi:Fe-S-cluster-containing dehydrogenase component